METDEGLTADWAMVKWVCNCFDKRREWIDDGKSSARSTTTGGRTAEVPTQSDKTRSRFESGPITTNVVEGPSGGATLDELMKMVCDVQIVQA